MPMPNLPPPAWTASRPPWPNSPQSKLPWISISMHLNFVSQRPKPPWFSNSISLSWNWIPWYLSNAPHFVLRCNHHRCRRHQLLRRTLILITPASTLLRLALTCLLLSSHHTPTFLLSLILRNGATQTGHRQMSQYWLPFLCWPRFHVKCFLFYFIIKRH